jgi:hypothetical protein
MNAHLFLRGIDNPALGARGRLYLARPDVKEAGLTLDDLYQQVRDLYNEFSRINRLDLLPKVLRDYAGNLDLSVDDIAQALSISLDQARILVEYTPMEARATKLQQLWAQAIQVSQSTMLRDPLITAATALAQQMRDENASVSDIASANNISVDVVNEFLTNARVENFIDQAQVAEIQTVSTLNAEQKAQWYASQVAKGLNNAQIRLNAEAVLGAQSDEDWEALQALAISLGLLQALPVATFATESEIAAQVRAISTMSAKDKADFYNRLLAEGYTDAGIRLEIEVALGEQSDSDWAALQALAESMRPKPVIVPPVVEDISRGIDATTIVTVPAAPSDQAVPVADFSDLTSPLALPGDWDSYSEAFKIAWFNANQIKPSQLVAAGVPTSDIAYMRANGYTVQEQAPAAGGGYGLLLALASAYFLGA